MKVNGVEKIFRAHQLCNDGFQVFWKGKVNTVWSAPNYCYRCGNKASILEVYDDSGDPDSLRFNVFDASPDSEKEFLRIESDNMDLELDIDEGRQMNKKAPYVEYFM